MSTSSPALGRPADRTNLIVRELRGQIVNGTLAPGSQLPTRAEIEANFGAGATTVQRALEHLRRDGFIEVNGRQGTFVVENPPHLTNYALVFSSNPSEIQRWTRFWTALNSEAMALKNGQEYRLHVYYNADKSTGDSEDFRRLVKEVQAHRLAGIIFASNPYVVDETPLLDEGGIRRVAIMGSERRSNCRAVNPDMGTFWEKAIGRLAAHGRKRVAVLLPPGLLSSVQETVAEKVRAAGMHIEPFWIQGLNTAAPYYTRNTIQLLLQGPPEHRPDALIIADDNFVEHATAGLVAAGVSVPHDVDVIAHCNFPHPPASALPLTFLGFDARQILLSCIESLRSPDPAGEWTRVPALFENEIQPARFSGAQF